MKCLEMEAKAERKGKDDSVTVKQAARGLRGWGWADTSVLKVWPRNHQQQHLEVCGKGRILSLPQS